MLGISITVWIMQIVAVLLAISLGKSIVTYRIRKEETRKKELELALLERRARILEEGKKIAVNLEDLLYKAQIQKEIDDIIRKSGTR